MENRQTNGEPFEMDPDKMIFTFDLNRIADQAVPCDEDGLPAESFDMFSETPLDFNEMAAGLWKDLKQVYELTGTLNRFSRGYPECCRLLEKLIKRVGSCCVTKAALERKGFEFPGLKCLDLKDLYCMVSFNFRKTRTAFIEGKKDSGCADMGLLEQECRLVDLADRLRATEEKIRQIIAGKIDYERIIERARLYKGQKGIVRDITDSLRPSLAKARALPAMTSVIRKVLDAQKAGEKEERELEKLLDGDVPPFKPLRMKDFRKMIDEKKAQLGSASAEALPPAEKKDDSHVKSAVESMRKSAVKKGSAPDPKLDREFDESLHRVFESHKQFMGLNKGTPLPGRA